MATDQLIARDAVIRQAAFDHVRALQSRDLVLSHEDIARGFTFEGQRWPLWNPQRGIFKPRGMPFLLSIRTVFPRKGGRVWYDDQRHVHGQIFAGEAGSGGARRVEGGSSTCRPRLSVLPQPPTRLASRSALIRALESSFLHVGPLHEKLGDPRLRSGESLAPNPSRA